MSRIFWTDVRDLYRERKREDWEPLLDDYRKELAGSCRQERDRERSVAAGLLLQYGLAAVKGSACSPAPAQWIRVFPGQLEEQVTEPVRIRYRISPLGKPWLDCEKMGIEPPLYISISHSGFYAACAVSHEPVGMDIQEERELDWRRLLKKLGAAEACEQEDFWRLWTCKEACGKLTGKGLAAGLSVRVEEGTEYVWEQARPENLFYGAVCSYAGGRIE